MNARSLCAAQREFRLQFTNAGQNTDNFSDTEFGVVSRKLDRLRRLRERRLAVTSAANERSLIRREFGSLLQESSAKPD